ncbi:MAG: hypothetical protein GX121_01555 [Ignavibacteria bacterium]|nr:hypothetical protein [Ignavibacteria bacterium]
MLLQACNPFAPRLAEDIVDINIISDQKTVEGVFDNFRYAYIFKDSLVYCNLLADDFVFVYRNYDQGVDISWGRDEDMRTTAGLFQASQTLDLVWNDAILSIGDSLNKDLWRGFNLSIVFSPSDIVNVQGRANFRLTRNLEKDIWQISKWRDESNY